MADVQKENGYTTIAHDILKALARHVISPDQWRVLMIIFWKTYGWGKKEDWISLQQFQDLTGIKRSHVSRAISKLLKRRIIFRGVTQTGNSYPNRQRSVTKPGNSQIPSYGLQKDYEKWVPLGVTRSGNGTVTRSGNELLPDQVHTKEDITKEKDLITLSDVPTVTQTGNSDPKPKKGPKTFPEDSDASRLAALLLQKILDRKPNFKKPNLQTWAGATDKIMRIDGRTPISVENVIVWCQKDDFWQNNILSPEKLRQKFDQLEMKMEKETGVAPYRKGNGKGSLPPESEFLKKIRQAREEIEKEKSSHVQEGK